MVIAVLVTGAAGFIGAHLCQRLLAEGHEVVGVDNLNDYYDPQLKRDRLAALTGGNGFTFHALDISDAAALMALPDRARIDRVVHLAAQAGVRYSLENPHAYGQSNLMGHLSVLEFCRHHDRLDRLVYASSSSVYGLNHATPYCEDVCVDRPVSLYAATKASAELLSQSYAHLYGITQVGLRFFTVYGPWGRPDMAYWLFTDAMLKAKPIRIFNGGKMRRDFTYIDDIINGVLATTTQRLPLAADETPHRIYNIGNNTPVELMDMIAILENATGVRAIREMHPMQPGDVFETAADITRMATDFGFSPATPLEVGLARFVDWFRGHYAL